MIEIDSAEAQGSSVRGEIAIRSGGGDDNGPVPPLSILHVLAPAPFGGLETVVRALAAGHARRGHTVHVATGISPRSDKHPFVAALEAHGVRALAVVVNPRDYRGERAAVRELFQRLRPDVVHTHGFRTDVVVGGVARSERIPLVSTCHGFIEGGWRSRFYQWLQRRALRRFDAVVAVSSSVEKKLRDAGIDRTKLHLVRNSFARTDQAVSRDDARRILGLPAVPVIGWVGRLSAEKGADLALDAFSRVRTDGVYLAMVGEGRDASRLRDRAAGLGIDERVVWTGAVPEVGRLLSAFDVFFLSSRSEGTPMALLEAMAAKVPIVATRVGGVPDVVDETFAWLVDSEDVAGMALALDEVFAQPERARASAEAARIRLAERFGPDQWLSTYEDLYRAVTRDKILS